MSKTVLCFMVLFTLLISGVEASAVSNVSDPSIIVNLPSRTIELYSGSTFVKEYPIAIGKPSTPTPIGDFSVILKEVDPWWYPPGKGYVVPSGPDNPLGYRWIGFYGNYGIHGTNAPWAIGQAVSNGCIRMYEENVEELFGVIGYGTPVKVTYDRIKVRVNNKGELLVGIFPDVYGYKEITVTDVKEKLAEKKLDGIISDDEIVKLINDESDSMVVAAKLFKVRVNGRTLPVKGVQIENKKYLPAIAIADALGVKAAFNYQSHTVQVESKMVPAVQKGKIIYINDKDYQNLFGDKQAWAEEQMHSNTKMPIVYVNSRADQMRIEKIEGILAIPVFQVARGLGVEVKWDSSQKIMKYQDKVVPIKMLGEEPFIQITQIYNVFEAYVYWDIGAGRIELTYPFKIIL